MPVPTATLSAAIDLIRRNRDLPTMFVADKIRRILDLADDPRPAAEIEADLARILCRPSAPLG